MSRWIFWFLFQIISSSLYVRCSTASYIVDDADGTVRYSAGGAWQPESVNDLYISRYKCWDDT